MMVLVVLSIYFMAVAGSDTGCVISNNCDGPAMICYKNYGNCICANGSCLCDGRCGPVWWLIVIIVLIFLLAVVGLILLLRCCCSCGKGYVRVA